MMASLLQGFLIMTLLFWIMLNATYFFYLVHKIEEEGFTYKTAKNKDVLLAVVLFVGLIATMICYSIFYICVEIKGKYKTSNLSGKISDWLNKPFKNKKGGN